MQLCIDGIVQCSKHIFRNRSNKRFLNTFFLKRSEEIETIVKDFFFQKDQTLFISMQIAAVGENEFKIMLANQRESLAKFNLVIRTELDD